MLLLKGALWLLVSPGAVLVYVPWALAAWGAGRIDVGSWRWAGLIPLSAGVAALLWCFADFLRLGGGTPAPIHAPRRLVVSGLYRRVRNPMYLGFFLALAGEALLSGLWTILMWGAALGLGLHLFVVLREEPRLRALFGAEYEDYLRRVPRWIPR